MSAVNVFDEVCKLVVRDCLLIIFKNTPCRFAAEDADVVRGMKSQRKEYAQK